MEKFNSREEAFASQNFNPEAVIINGVPDHIIEAAKAFINLCVAHDAVNPEFQPDFTNSSQRKYNVIHEMGSSSGVGFAYDDCDGWYSVSLVGSRLVSESYDAAIHIEEICHEDYKAMKVYDRQIQPKKSRK
jgi:hypothetical protein